MTPIHVQGRHFSVCHEMHCQMLHLFCEFPPASWTPSASAFHSNNEKDIANMPVEAKWHWLKLLMRGTTIQRGNYS